MVAKNEFEFIFEGHYANIYLFQNQRLFIFPTEKAHEDKRGILKYKQFNGDDLTIKNLLIDIELPIFFYKSEVEKCLIINKEIKNDLYIYSPTSLNNPIEEFFGNCLMFNKIWRVCKSKIDFPIWSVVLK